MNAIITSNGPVDIHYYPNAAIRPIHRDSGLWIFRCTSAGTTMPPEEKRQERLWRYFEFYAISHMYDGEGIFCLPDQKRQPVAAGKCILVSPRLIHYYGAAPERYYSEDTVNFSGPLADMLFRSGIFANGVFDLGPTRKLLPIIDLAADPSDNAQLNANFALQKLLHELYNRRFLQSSHDRYSRIDALLDELKSDPCKWWTLADMAQFCNIGTDQFRRLFNDRVGMKPKLYIDRLRMNHAARQLIESEATIAEIAAANGYSDPFHFSRRFKAVMGLPPHRYREESERL